MSPIGREAIMATPMSADQLRSALKRWKVPVVEESRDGIQWHNHNRNSRGPWGPANGVVVHHTGDDAPDTADLRVLWYGRSDLGGPLCQFALDDLGIVHLVGLGRTNHAGGGDPTVLDAVIAESYEKYPPKSKKHQGSPGAVDGNARFYGIETMYSGLNPMTPAAYLTLVRLLAAICSHHGWSAKSVIGHKEWSDWKIDPGSQDMAALRDDVASALKAGAWPVPTPAKPAPVVPKPEGPDEMFLIDRTSQRVYVYGFGAPPTYIGVSKVLHDLRDGGAKVAETNQTVIDYLTKVHVAEQAKLVAALIAALKPTVAAATPETLDTVLTTAVNKVIGVLARPTPVVEDGDI